MVCTGGDPDRPCLFSPLPRHSPATSSVWLFHGAGLVAFGSSRHGKFKGGGGSPNGRWKRKKQRREGPTSPIGFSDSGQVASYN